MREKALDSAAWRFVLHVIRFSYTTFALTDGSMYACQWRDSVSCLRNLFFFFLVHSFVIHGFAQDSNRKIKGKIVLESYPKEDKIKTSNSPRRDAPLSHRGKITNDDKPYHDFGKQYSNNQRQNSELREILSAQLKVPADGEPKNMIEAVALNHTLSKQLELTARLNTMYYTKWLIEQFANKYLEEEELGDMSADGIANVIITFMEKNSSKVEQLKEDLREIGLPEKEFATRVAFIYVRSKRLLNNYMQKRSATPLADEDLFEFMVRIANTPAEWERIRRVLSLINQAERKSDPDSTTATSLRNRTETHVSHDDRIENGTKSNVSASAQRVDIWPSNKWIRNLIDTENDEKVDFADEDDYFEPEEEDEEEEDDDDEEDDSTNDNYTFEREKSITNRTENVGSNDDGSRMIIPNEKLPNFVYRRVKPAVADSNEVENSAYIAVSVVSPHSVLRKQNPEADSTTQRPITVAPTSTMDTQFELIQKYLLQTRQRHSRRKYDKT